MCSTSASFAGCARRGPCSATSRKTMSDLRGVIVSHAAVAQALVAAVTAITGIDGVLTPVSNEGCGTDALTERLTQALGSGPAVLFVDLPGGSCFTTSLRLPPKKATTAPVPPVHPALLLAFVFF